MLDRPEAREDQVLHWLYRIAVPGIIGQVEHRLRNLAKAPTGYVYRTGQAWKGGAGSFMGAATYFYDNANNTLEFTFNTGNLDWTGPVGFHWTMKCGNDVVEGQVSSVPEPATMLLVGLGLIGLAGMRRKIRP